MGIFIHLQFKINRHEFFPPNFTEIIFGMPELTDNLIFGGSFTCQFGTSFQLFVGKKCIKLFKKKRTKTNYLFASKKAKKKRLNLIFSAFYFLDPRAHVQ